jgi:Transposase DDE domain group 1
VNDPMLPLPGLSPVSAKPVVARFDGGHLSSDGGVLLLREIAERLGFAERLAACMHDPRDQDQIVHTLAAPSMAVSNSVCSTRIMTSTASSPSWCSTETGSLSPPYCVPPSAQAAWKSAPSCAVCSAPSGPIGLTLARCKSDSSGHSGLTATDANVFARPAAVIASNPRLRLCSMCYIRPIISLTGYDMIQRAGSY